MIDRLHQRGLGVILDWVPSHFPTDAHGLYQFDGTHLYEHADPRQGYHPDWNSAIFNYGRNEVRSFLLSSAMCWLDRYHVDGIRVDAVASMLYLDYSRQSGEWIPNQYGGRENLEAIGFMRQLNEAVYGEYPDIVTHAEESTAWPGVSRPTYLGGLGFGGKWDMGWMHDTLQYLQRDPIHRKWHHSEVTFRSVYMGSENYVLPLSHDEVVHGKSSLLAKMPGDEWQKFANLRLLYAMQWFQPGKKLLFMGDELATWNEWSHESTLDWSLHDAPMHEGVRLLLADLNSLYRSEPAMHRGDYGGSGMQWVEAHDAEHGVFAWLRVDPSGRGPARARGRQRHADTAVQLSTRRPGCRPVGRVAQQRCGDLRRRRTRQFRWGRHGAARLPRPSPIGRAHRAAARRRRTRPRRRLIWQLIHGAELGRRSTGASDGVDCRGRVGIGDLPGGRSGLPRTDRVPRQGWELAVVLALLGSALTRARVRRPAEAAIGRIPGGGVLQISVPEAFGGKTVIGQLTVDQVVGAGFVTAFGCDDGIPTNSDGSIARSDLNYDAAVASFASNRLIVKADNNGDICFYTLRPAALIVDVNAVTFDTGISSFANRRTDTRTDRTHHAWRAVACCACRFPRRSAARPSSANSPSTRSPGRDSSPPSDVTTGIPTDSAGAVTRSDLNYDARVSPVASNRLIVKADGDGDVCFYTLRSAALVIDINGVSDAGIASFDNQRTDTRTGRDRLVEGGGVFRVPVPEAAGGKTVVGQLTVDQVVGAGFVTAYGCDDGIPTDSAGTVTRSDLNYDAAISPVASNRLIVKADSRRRHLLLHAPAGRPRGRHQRRIRGRHQLVPQPAHRHADGHAFGRSRSDPRRWRAGVATVRAASGARRAWPR